MILLNAKTGKVVSADGRSIVSDDPDGKDFPWAPKSFVSVLSQGPLINKIGADVKWENVKGSYLGLYFSAHWVSKYKLRGARL